MLLRSMAVAFMGALMFASPTHAATVSIHGSTTVNINVITPNLAAIEAKSGHKLDVVANGSGRGLADLVEGKANLAMISAPLAEVVAKVNEKEPGKVDVATLKAEKIGEAKVIFAVSLANKVKSLTLKQLAGILNGTTKKWSEVGGDDTPILIVTENAKGGIRTVVEDNLLNKASIAGNIRELANASQVAKVVAQIPQAIGMIPMSSLDSSLTEIKLDTPVAQPLIVVTKGAATPEQQAVIDAIKGIAKK